MTIETTQFSHIQEALARTYGDHPLAWAEYEDLLKAANAHKLFWRPIEECPRERGKEYLLIIRGLGNFSVGTWSELHKSWWFPVDECFLGIVSHFAEIPPLPEEAKP